MATQNSKNEEQLIDLMHVVNTLIQGGYEFTGIKYLYISCSSHVLAHTFRGIEIKYDRSQMEQLTKGRNISLDVFAYYGNKCYQLTK